MKPSELYKNRKFDPAADTLKYRSRYNFGSDELQDLIGTATQPFHTQLIDLSVAAPLSNPLLIPIAGRSVVMYGVTSASTYDPVANTGIETVASAAFVYCYLNVGGNSGPQLKQNFAFPLKHNRGYRGDFTGLALTFPAQANTKARIFIYQFDDIPFYCGEAAT